MIMGMIAAELWEMLVSQCFSAGYLKIFVSSQCNKVEVGIKWLDQG